MELDTMDTTNLYRLDAEGGVMVVDVASFRDHEAQQGRLERQAQQG